MKVFVYNIRSEFLLAGTVLCALYTVSILPCTCTVTQLLKEEARDYAVVKMKQPSRKCQQNNRSLPLESS